MRKIALPAGGLLFASLLLAGCAAEMGGYSDASVTRFHLGQPIARGAIAVEPADTADANSLEFNQIARSVERELARLGWAVDERNGGTEQVAVVRVDQAARAGAARRRRQHRRRRRRGELRAAQRGRRQRRRHRAGDRQSPRADLVATLLSVRIQRRSDATVAWEGRAEMEAPAGSPYAGRAAAADRLAAALFRDFPGESGRTIRVR